MTAGRPWRVLFRLDAGPAVGLGHVGRCLPVARALARRGAEALFVMAGGEPGPGRVLAAGFPVTELAPGAAAFRDWLDRERPAVDAYFFDVRDDVCPGDLARLRRQAVVAVLDDPTDKRLAADLAFYPPVPGVADLPWAGFGGRLHVGFDWVPLDLDLPGRAAEAAPVPPDGRLPLLVTMGGTDPQGLSELALAALALVRTPIFATVVVGAACPRLEACRALAEPLANRVRLVVGPVDLIPLMRASRLALAAFGVTAYELAALGVPALLLGLTPEHVRSAGSLAAAGAARIAGEGARLSPEDLARQLDALVADPAGLTAMAQSALDLPLGPGADNIARELLLALERRS